MRRVFVYYIMIVLSAALLQGCAILPFGKNVRVRKQPGTIEQVALANYSLQKNNNNNSKWWIAWSDRDPNNTCVSPSNDMTVKKLGFMDAVCIVKQKGDYVKVIQYSPDIDLTAIKGKIAKKTAKNYGWVKKEKLLSQPFCFNDNSSGFAIKGIVKLNGTDILKKADQYLFKDSLVIFNSPKLLIPSGNNIPPGTIVYIYKQSDDKKSFLIGKEADFTNENAKQNVLGWISKDAITVWGTRSAFTWQPGDTAKNNALYAYPKFALAKDSLMLLAASTERNRLPFENIFPIQNNKLKGDSVLQTAYLDNIVDYTNNDVYNVLGNTITYNQYKKILNDAQHINVVFVLDVSSNNRLYFPYVKSAIQDLQLYFDTSAIVKHYKFGAVTYKQIKCKADTLSSSVGLTGNFAEIEHYLEQKIATSSCNDEVINQPLYHGLADACNLLKPVKNETNIIVLVGTTGNMDADGKYTLDNVINQVSNVRARLLLLQSISKKNDAYNDFVLGAEKVVTNSAANIGELKKEVLVDINDVIYSPSYNLQVGDSGVFSLDYPAKSMVQGFVLFPKKGDVMPAGFLKGYFDTLMTQVMKDNNNVSKKLKDYFHNIGIKSTSFKPGFAGYVGNLPLPQQFAKAFNDTQNGYFIPAFIAANPLTDSTQPVRYGLLLNEKEYDRLTEQLYTIYKKTAAREHFKQRRAYRKYKKYVRTYAKENNQHPDGKIKMMSLADAVYLYSGYVSSDTTDNITTLRNLKKMDKVKALDIFNNFKYAADAMQENKNTGKVKINNNGNVYYWLDDKILPTGTVSRKKAEE